MIRRKVLCQLVSPWESKKKIKNNVFEFFFSNLGWLIGQLVAKSVGPSAIRSVAHRKKIFKTIFFFENLCWSVDGNNDDGDNDDGNNDDDDDNDDDSEGSDTDRNEMKSSYEKQILSNRVGNIMRPAGIRRYIRFLMDIH